MAKQQKVNRICLAWQGMPGHDVWNCHTPSLCWLIHKVEEVLNVSECMMSCAKRASHINKINATLLHKDCTTPQLHKSSLVKTAKSSHINKINATLLHKDCTTPQLHKSSLVKTVAT